MSNVYFVRMNEMKDGYYDGYKDFYRLAELSRYPVIWFDEVDVHSDNTYILTPRNGTWHNGWENPKARLIHWDLEWRIKGAGYQWEKADYEEIPGVPEVWASDAWYAKLINAKYVPLGSHPGLVEDNRPAEPHFDVTLQCYMSGRRTFIADRMMEQGLTIAPSKWNPDRDALLKSTTAMLHIHQWETDGVVIKTVAPLRFAIAAAYGLPLISEKVEDPDIFKDVVLFSDYDAMPAYAKTLTGRYQAELRERGRALHDLLCETHSFRSFVEAAL